MMWGRGFQPAHCEYQLRKVFKKLGVSSRVELASLPLAPVAIGATGATDCQGQDHGTPPRLGRAYREACWMHGSAGEGLLMARSELL